MSVYMSMYMHYPTFTAELIMMIMIAKTELTSNTFSDSLSIQKEKAGAPTVRPFVAQARLRTLACEKKQRCKPQLRFEKHLGFRRSSTEASSALF